MIFNFFIICVNSWGPIFHQIVASEFISEYLPNIKPEQRKYFILGSIYVDGLPKPKSHNIEEILRVLNTYEPHESNEWWFVLGFLLHMTADISGHIGYPLSFLPLRKPIHYIAELVSCSAIYHTRKPEFLPDDPLVSAVYETFGGGSSRRFALLYYVWRLLAKLPFYKFLGTIENDKCDKRLAMCNFERHITTIKDLMWDSIGILQEGNHTHENLGYIVTQDLKRFKCCT